MFMDKLRSVVAFCAASMSRRALAGLIAGSLALWLGEEINVDFVDSGLVVVTCVLAGLLHMPQEVRSNG